MPETLKKTVVTLRDRERLPWETVTAYLVPGSHGTMCVNRAPADVRKRRPDAGWQVCHATAGLLLAGGFETREAALHAGFEAFEMAFAPGRNAPERLHTWETPRIIGPKRRLTKGWCREAQAAFGRPAGRWLVEVGRSGARTGRHVRLMKKAESIATENIPAGMGGVARAYADYARGAVAFDIIARSRGLDPAERRRRALVQ